MISVWRNIDELRRESAATWVVRLEAAGLGDAEALAFDAWLSGSAENAAAFDTALATSHDFAASAQQVARGVSARRIERNHGPDRRHVLGGVGIAAAAVFAVVVAPQYLSPPQTTTYETGKGELRSIALADGSRVDLNAGTRMTVTLARNARSVRLYDGQAVFDVSHDAKRPFTVAAGDRLVRVVGTQFDVRQREGKLSVTVARGAVEVRPQEGAKGKAYRLRPGQRLERRDGALETLVANIRADEVLSWRAGRMVYRDQPLSDVIADLNEQWATPVLIEDPALATTPVSGVLILDNQDAVIGRLALLVPIRAVRSDAGIVLRRDTTSNRK